jgi:hypothetical protein
MLINPSVAHRRLLRTTTADVSYKKTVRTRQQSADHLLDDHHLRSRRLRNSKADPIETKTRRRQAQTKSMSMKKERKKRVNKHVEHHPSDLINRDENSTVDTSNRCSVDNHQRVIVSNVRVYSI